MSKTLQYPRCKVSLFMSRPSTTRTKMLSVRFPLKITLTYVIAGALWLGFSDYLLLRSSHRDSLVNLINYITDPIYILITACLIFWISNVHISSIKRSEEALRQSNERFDMLIHSSPLAILSIDLNLNVTSWNPAAEVIFGWSAEEILGCQVPYVPKNRQCEATAIRERIINEGSATGIEVIRQRKDGAFINVSISSAALHDAHGNANGIVCVVADITERKLAEEQLFAEKERLTVTLRSIGDGVITTDHVGNIVLINPAAEELTGWSYQEIHGKPVTTVFQIVNERTGEQCPNPVNAVLQTGQLIGLSNHTALITHENTRRIIASSAAPIRDHNEQIIGAVLVFRDMTQKQKLDDELRKADKLESVGVLAGGIAHDFNNLLAAILGNITLAQMALTPGDPVLPKLIEAEKASLRARDLTQQLLTFAKGGLPIKKTASITELISESVSFALIGSKTRCDIQIADNIWPVEVDEGQINQVIGNLVINADQAMANGGVISVNADNITFDNENLLALPSGNYVRIQVRDNGVGIPAEYLSKIFDPYFTTKQRGNGLGLATCYSIMQRHNGHIAVESTIGCGTTFTLYLPASTNLPTVDTQLQPTLTKSHGNVLVIDDEEIIREVVVSMLESIGYEASAVSDGQQAIESYRSAMTSSSPFDAVIMDLTIPGGYGGKEIITHLLEIDPTVRAIVSSGYSTDPIMSDYATYGFRGVIAKPYKISELAELMEQVLQKDRIPTH
ncbi:MAG TPA: PAS domain S-box protein [Armatimonadota bacterium]|nr:PAS domain S-box protein [Armatimonadota bacterium]